MTASATGACLCGAIGFEAIGEALWVGHCHCHSCRRHTGSAVATFAGYRREQLHYTRGTPSVYVSSPGVRRSFCSHCGTPLSYEADRFPGEIHVYVGTLDNPEDFEPQFHVYCSEQLPWLELADDLPRKP